MPQWQFSLYIAFVGLGMGCIFPVVTTAVQNAVPRETDGHRHRCRADVPPGRRLAGGGAVRGALRHADGGAAGRALPTGAGGGLEIGPQTLAGLPPALRDRLAEAVVAALHPIYWIAVALALVGAVFALRLKEIPLRGRNDTAPSA